MGDERFRGVTASLLVLSGRHFLWRRRSKAFSLFSGYSKVSSELLMDCFERSRVELLLESRFI
jgi:hypothetical protein